MVLDVLVKATFVLGAAAAFSIVSRGRAAAALRHAVWVAALLGAVLLPALSAALPALRVPLFPAPTTSMTSSTFEPGPVEIDAPATPADLVPAAYPDTSPAIDVATDSRVLLRALRDLASGPVIVVAWALGAVLLLARVVMSRLSVARLTRARVPGRAPWLPVARRLARVMRVPRRLRFLRSDRVAMPMACGIVRPAIVLPAEADGWGGERLRAVLLHELGHVRRRDCLTQTAVDAALALLWFHPLAWVARRAIRRERERACDDLVLSAGTAAPDYASHLLDVARDARHRSSSLTLAGGVAMARPSELEGRLMAILDDARPRRAITLRTACVIGALSLALVAPMSALDLWQPSGVEARALPASPLDRPHTGRPTTVVPTPPTPTRALPARAVTADPAAGQEPTPTPTPTPMPAPAIAAWPAPVPAATAIAAVRATPVTAAVASLPAWSSQPTAAPAPPKPPPPPPAPETPSGVKASPKGKIAGKRTPADPRVIAALAGALADSDADVRRQALHTLARFRDPSTIDALAGALTHTDVEMRRHAAFALNHIRDPRATKALQAAMADADVQVRRQALFALARQRDPSVLEPLAAALKDSDPDVRRQAVFALGQLRDARAVPALVTAMGDSDRDVREQAVFALGQLRSAEAVTPLLAALEDGDVEIRQQAAFALGQIKDPRAVDALMVAAKDQHVDVRRQAFFALGQVGDTRAQELAIAGLEDSDAEVRRMAAFALARIADRNE